MPKVVHRSILPFIFHFPDAFVLAWGAQIEHKLTEKKIKQNNLTGKFGRAM